MWELAGTNKSATSCLTTCLSGDECLKPLPTEVRRLLQNHPSWHLGGWATTWLAEEMLDGQLQRVDIPAHARTAYNGLLLKRLDDNLCLIVPHVLPMTQSVKGLN